MMNDTRSIAAPSQDLSTADMCLSEAQLRQRGVVKWTQYDADVLPCWVADMDLQVAEPIKAAVRDSVEHKAFGYPSRNGRPPDRVLADAFVKRMERLYQWKIAPEEVAVVSDLVQAIYASIIALSAPGDGVILHMPSYPPFRAAISDTQRTLVPLHARIRNGRYAWDLGEISAEQIRSARIFMLCNPQNPTGRAMTRAELEEIADFVQEHDLIVVSDEIHADLVYPGAQHIPFASLSPEMAARTITLTSATKSFNIAGLRCAVMHFGSAKLMKRFTTALPLRVLGGAGVLGIDATLAAWEQCEDYLDRTRAHLLMMRDKLAALLAEKLPQLSFIPPEATYLSWIDCAKLQLPQSAGSFFLEKARVGFSAGETFDPTADQFVRLNFATSPRILEEIIDRMAKAVRR